MYLRHTYLSGQVIIHLVIAKTKLAPKKVLSIPKLELQAALMGARLADYVTNSLTRPVTRRRFWTDSSCVRNWIRSTAAYYKPFVSHRLGEIQVLTESFEWRFVPGRINCSDLATRSSIETIPDVWFKGPEFLYQPEEEWPIDLPWMSVVEEVKSARTFLAEVEIRPQMDWSSLQFGPNDLQNVIQGKPQHIEILQRCQEESFERELRRVKESKELHSSSSLLSLTPFIGKNGLLRLGGRIGRAPLPYENLHQIILPGNHPLTDKIVDAFHRGYRHAGIEFILSRIREHFWIVGGKEAVRRAKERCLECRRNRSKLASQLMGELPFYRLEMYTPPFTRTAIDYFGPLFVGFGRNRTTKRYGVLITCLVTRAVYLDLSLSLSTVDFLMVFRRFIGIYTTPRCVYSDNGTNFVGAEKELVQNVETLGKDQALRDFRPDPTAPPIEWKFQPPSAPHFGGAHESLVKSAKRALYEALDQEAKKHRYPSEETMRTLLFEVAGLLNTRPLTQLSPDPSDPRPLTPNDLLNRPSTSHFPTGSFKDALPSEHYRCLRRAVNIFWDLWKGPYLQSLIARKKWKKEKRNFAVGDHVLIADPNQPRGMWNHGVVSEVFPGPDNLVRVVNVKTEAGQSLRPITRLCLLTPADNSVQPESS